MKKLYQLIQKNLVYEKLFDLFQKKLPLPELPLITISREKGSGGRLIAHLVAKKLGKPWKVYHKEILEEIAKESHLEKQLIDEVDEKNVPYIEEIIDDFFGKKYFSLSNYHKQLTKVLSTIGQRGYAIIIGRGANYLLPNSLKVRTICEMEQRIKWEMQYENLTRKQAVALIEKSDEERLRFVKTLFSHDQRKAHHYDLVVRTGLHLSLEDAAELIAKMAKRRFKI